MSSVLHSQIAVSGQLPSGEQSTPSGSAEVAEERRSAAKEGADAEPEKVPANA